MVLQHDVGDVDMGLTRSMSEVEHEFHRIHVQTRQVALPEDVILTGLQVDVVCVDDSHFIIFVGQFDHHTVDITVGIEDTGEVVVDSGGSHKASMEMYLSLPFGIAFLWNGDIVVVVAHLEERSEGIGLLIAPTWIRIVVERHVRCDALPHVEVAVGIETIEFLLGLFAGEDVTPGNTAFWSLVDEHHLLGSQRLDAEPWVFVLRVTADIRESGVGIQLDVGLLESVSIDIKPFINLETPSSCLVADGGIEVGIRGSPLGSTRIDVSKSISTCIIGEGTALSVVGGEGDTVVVHTEILLLVGLSRPPFCTSCSSGTASQVGHFLVGETPFLASDAAEVGGIIHLGLVECVSL